MSPESGILQEVRFELDGRPVFAYLSFGRRRSDPAAGDSAEPTRWCIRVGGDQAFLGPVFRGYLQGDQREAEAELRRCLEDREAGGRVGQPQPEGFSP